MLVSRLLGIPMAKNPYGFITKVHFMESKLGRCLQHQISELTVRTLRGIPHIWPAYFYNISHTEVNISPLIRMIQNSSNYKNYMNKTI